MFNHLVNRNYLLSTEQLSEHLSMTFNSREDHQRLLTLVSVTTV